MTDSIPSARPEVTEPRREGRRQVRSFVWEAADGDEISACNDCRFWHVQVVLTGDPGYETTYIREWHEADCMIWQESAD